MNEPVFIQIHTLHSYPAALLNRDDDGRAKRMIYGDTVRLRISSQCLKRHWRTAKDKFSMHNMEGATSAVRSRNIIERKVMPSLRETGNYAEDVLKAVEEQFNTSIYGNKRRHRAGQATPSPGTPGNRVPPAERHPDMHREPP